MNKHQGFTNGWMLVAAVIAAAAPLSAAADSVSGFGKGTVNRSIDLISDRELLDSFFLRFTRGDEDIRHLAVTPSGAGVMIAFQPDGSWDDEYYYGVRYDSTANAGSYTGNISGVCVGSCSRAIDKPGDDYIFVLQGFRFLYNGEDHHIDEVAVFEVDSRLNVAFNDRNNDDTFWWAVKYAWVPQSRFSVVADVEEFNAVGADSAATPPGNTVLRGFSFDFDNSDRHLREIGVWSRNGSIEVYFSDDSANDPFDWFVDYGILKPAYPPVRSGFSTDALAN